MAVVDGLYLEPDSSPTDSTLSAGETELYDDVLYTEADAARSTNEWTQNDSYGIDLGSNTAVDDLTVSCQVG